MQETHGGVSPMRDYIKDACEEIDSAMFSGDAFADAEQRKALRDYMERWERELKNWDEIAAEAAS